MPPNNLWRHAVLLASAALCCSVILAPRMWSVSIPHTDSATASRALSVLRITQYTALPLAFEPNRGQAARGVDFLARGRRNTLYLTATGAVLALVRAATAATAMRTELLGLRLVGATAHPQVIGVNRLLGISNYLVGRDPHRWRTHLPTFAGVEYRNIYPGVDIVYYGNAGHLEYDLVVAPHSDPRRIRLALESLTRNRGQSASLHLDAQGDLVMRENGLEVRQVPPFVYQNLGGRRQRISGRYILDGGRSVGFAIGAYDARRPLIVDPVLNYSTYLGGGGIDAASSIAIDGAGNAYIAGSTQSLDFPTAQASQAAFGGGSFSGDAFVAKLNAAGNSLIYSTYLGGSGDDAATGIAVDPSGSAYVTGLTGSSDFPVQSALQSINAGYTDAFVAKLSADGSALAYSTYLGGAQDDSGQSIAVDANGFAYVTGLTGSPDFPTANALQSTFGGDTDAFIARLNQRGNGLVYSTYLGGSGADYGYGIALDGGGNVYIAGQTLSANFPTSAPLQHNTGGASDAFVVRLSDDGRTLGYSTYLGGSGDDSANAIAVDASGNAYITGYTASPDFPTSAPVQRAFGGGLVYGDAFVATLNAAGNGLIYSTYLGGRGDDAGNAIAVDASGSAVVAGQTSSTNFPVVDPSQAANRGGSDAFIARLSSGGSSLVYSTFLGGRGQDIAYGITMDAAGDAYVAGSTSSPDYPTVNAFQSSFGAATNPLGGNAFIAMLRPIGVGAAPSSGAVGIPILVHGNSFGAGEPIRLYWDTQSNPLLESVTAAGDGSFTASVSVPTSSGGTHIIIAVGQTSGQRASTPFLLRPSMQLTPANGAARAIVKVRGFGFGAREIVNVRWNSRGGQVVSTTMSNGQGSFNLRFKAPGGPRGTHKVYGIGASSHIIVAVAFSIR